MSDFLFFSGSSNLPLAQKVARGLGIKLSKAEIDHFSNNETRVRVDENVKAKTCIILGSMNDPVEKNWVELLFFIDALKRAGAKKIIGIIPWLGYQKQDKAFRSGEAVSVAVVIKTLETLGMEKIVTFDLHNPGIVNYFENKPIVLSALPLFLRHCNNAKMFVMVAPDAGAFWAEDFAKKLGIDFLQLEKRRDKKTARITFVLQSRISARLDGKTAIMIDDMIYTGQTLIQSAEILKKMGAKKVICFATHAIFSGNAASDLQNSEIDSLTVTDTILIPEEKRFPKLKIISVGQSIINALKDIHVYTNYGLSVF